MVLFPAKCACTRVLDVMVLGSIMYSVYKWMSVVVLCSLQFMSSLEGLRAVTLTEGYLLAVRCLMIPVVHVTLDNNIGNRNSYLVVSDAPNTIIGTTPCNFRGGTADGRLDWGPSFICKGDSNCSNATGNPDTGDDFPLAPDVDHLNLTVRKDIVDWMNWLKTEIGFDGWLFSMATGYSPRIT
ncbi:hypothetical protein RHGRI_032302 [Rhododendron griersonianum]|uniref:1,4-alpha-D-glucan glucanohydrolase n=1 Tax=Rhododendron griersonianum TaxID=479676 RepID=A0AAV6IG47_9ERIC|nr:hypothetical protein RHGRI_032302 [Rhododendron griersonianum]